MFTQKQLTVSQQVSVFLSYASTHQTLTGAETEYVTFVFSVQVIITARCRTLKHHNIKGNV